MATVKEFYDYIDKLYPFSAQENWDNSGFLIGDKNAEVTRAAVVLDITLDAIDYAHETGAQLIISHHPIIYRAQKSFAKGNRAYELAVRGMSAICAHTSLDCADGGVNDVFANALGVENAEVFPCEEGESFVRAGILPSPMSAGELACHIKETLGGSVRYCDTGKIIESVALCGGAGKDFIPDIIKAGIDAYITGDAGYHDFLDSKDAGLCLFSAGHFETENPVVAVLANKLRVAFEDTDIIVIPQSTPIITE